VRTVSLNPYKCASSDRYGAIRNGFIQSHRGEEQELSRAEERVLRAPTSHGSAIPRCDHVFHCGFHGRYALAYKVYEGSKVVEFLWVGPKRAIFELSDEYSIH
jgi:hypothetical protein